MNALPGASLISVKDLVTTVAVAIWFLVISMSKVLLACLLCLAELPTLGTVLVIPKFFKTIHSNGAHCTPENIPGDFADPQILVACYKTLLHLDPFM